MEARIRATMEARAADFAAGTGPTISSRSSMVQTAAQMRELIEDEDLDSATEEDTGALGRGNPNPAFSGRHLRVQFPITGLGLLILSSSNRTFSRQPP